MDELCNLLLFEARPRATKTPSMAKSCVVPACGRPPE